MLANIVRLCQMNQDGMRLKSWSRGDRGSRELLVDMTGWRETWQWLASAILVYE